MEEPTSYPSSPLQRFGLAINFFFPALAFIVLVFRLYSKVCFKSQGPGTFRHPSTLLGPDDVFACLSMLFSIGLTIGSYYWIVTNFVGIRADQIPSQYNPRMALIWTYVVHLLYFPTLALIKSSILVFLLQLGGHTRRFRVVIHCLNGINLAFMVAVFGGSVGQCTPVSSFWDLTLEHKCINQPVFYLSQTGLNLLTDAFTLGVPIWIFKATEMGRRLKLATLYVFLLGTIVTLIGIARFVFLYMLFYSDARFLEHYTMSFTLSAVETNLAIVCACAPTLRGLVRTWFPRALTAANEYNVTDLDPYTEAKSVSAAGTGDSGAQSKPIFNTSERFTYRKDGRGRVLCSHPESEGLGLTPSEEDIMRSNGILRRTDVVVEHGDDYSLRSASTIEERDRRGSGGS